TPLLVVVCLAGLTNLPLKLWAEQVQYPDVWPMWSHTAERLIRIVVGLDILILTILLGLSGGPDNPFAIFYFANLTLAAVFFPRSSPWVMTGLAVACYGSLFLWSVKVPELQVGADPGSLRLQGMFAAFVTAAPVIVYFTSRVTRALAQRELELAESQQK